MLADLRNTDRRRCRDGEAKRIQCMASDCPSIVDEKTVEMLMDDATSQKWVSGRFQCPLHTVVYDSDHVFNLIFNRYKRLLNRAYVDDNPSLRWCPAPDCTFAIECHVPNKSLDSVVPSVRCQCGHFFCFGCSQEDHRPCICRLAKLWLRKCSDDSETANWISANTKECPKCLVRPEVASAKAGRSQLTFLLCSTPSRRMVVATT